MDDREAEGFLQASSWEHMSGLCEEHARASKEHVAAEIESFLQPSLEADVRLVVAEVALNRAEKRLIQ